MSKYQPELDTDTWKRALNEAAEIGVIHAHFSGGEPMVRNDLLELVRTARQADLYTDLSTSAYTANEKNLTELKEAGLDAIQISILDSTPEGNDYIAGAKCFDQKCDAFRIAKELEFPISLNVVLHRHNLDRLEDIMEMACEWGVERIELAHTQFNGWAFKNRLALLPTPEQLENAKEIAARYEDKTRGKIFILNVLPDYYQDRPKACVSGWGSTFISIAPDGAVLPCQAAREFPGMVFPNIKNESLGDIWYNSEPFRRFRGTDWLPETCKTCERQGLDYGGCRCQAFLLTGDPGLIDPVCQKSPNHHLIEEALQQAATGDVPPLEHRVFNAPQETM